ncbi:putative peptide chain release factor 2, partial [Trichinella spiralis]|uniref:putative peptide chain release factor 2 n=1 Tax=Trichinella spiralis TaxID=6334 RepID=UPI0001EFEDC7
MERIMREWRCRQSGKCHNSPIVELHGVQVGRVDGALFPRLHGNVHRPVPPGVGRHLRTHARGAHSLLSHARRLRRHRHTVDTPRQRRQAARGAHQSLHPAVGRDHRWPGARPRNQTERLQVHALPAAVDGGFLSNDRSRSAALRLERPAAVDL